MRRTRLSQPIVFALVSSCLVACINLVRSTPTPAPPIIEPLYPQMVRVEPGTFRMGRDDGNAKEGPQHPVTLTRAYEIGTYAVTYAEFDRFCDDTARSQVDPEIADRRRPVSSVDWYDAVAYCDWLSERAGLTPCYTGGGKVTRCDFDASGYRLPTEAEWEYAARGGSLGLDTRYAGGDDPGAVGWHAGNSGGQAHPVGELAPNELGLYDMSGNRWEWCWDWHDGGYYATSPMTDPSGPTSMPKGDWVERSRRGGSAVETVDALRVTYRSADFANYPGDNGFRLVRTVAEAT